MSRQDPYVLLGISDDASEAQIRRAWRQKARSVHPDVGGTTEEMLRLNEAALHALSEAKSRDSLHPASDSANNIRAGHASSRHVERDMSSFTIDRLPVDAWHLLEIAAAQCGPLVEESPPYLMEFLLHDAPFIDLIASICRCELVPEAGSTTVHLTVLDVPRLSDASIRVRDLLVTGINQIADDD